MRKSGSDFVRVWHCHSRSASECFAALFEATGGKRKSLCQQQKMFARLLGLVCVM